MRQVKFWIKLSSETKVTAFKSQPNRFLCFFVANKKIVITNAFEKKSQKLPANAKERAIKARKGFLTRTENS